MTKKRDRKLGKRYGKEPHGGATLWIYGVHAAAAAIDNPEREVLRILATENMLSRLGMPEDIDRPRPEMVEPKAIEQYLPNDAVHQGLAVQVRPLESYQLDDILDLDKPIVVLDQVTDPHNVGAVMRSAAAFDAAGVVITHNHAPKETAVMAKSACGAMDIVPLVTVTNLANTLRELKDEGYWIWGMDGQAKEALRAAKPDAKTVLVMGAEGKGLRRLTEEMCDLLVKLPIHGQMESLNVSAAAAIALYEMAEARS